MSVFPSLTAWDDFFDFAESIEARTAQHAVSRRTAESIAAVAAYIRQERLDLPPAGPCAGCTYHEINTPDGAPGCAADECIERGEAV